MEFGLVALLIYTPLLLGTFVVGMNPVKTIQAKNTIRDMADLYIHGADFSDGGYQALAKELGTGLNLQSPAFAAGSNTGTGELDNITCAGRNQHRVRHCPGL